MGIQAKRKLYLCCERNQKPFFKAKAESLYGDKWILHDRLEEADLIMVIGKKRTADMEQEIIQGNQLGISVQYVNERFINEEIYDALLSNRKEIKIRQTEKSKSHERER